MFDGKGYLSRKDEHARVSTERSEPGAGMKPLTTYS
jgi:hypothetical protein